MHLIDDEMGVPLEGLHLMGQDADQIPAGDEPQASLRGVFFDLSVCACVCGGWGWGGEEKGA